MLEVTWVCSFFGVWEYSTALESSAFIILEKIFVNWRMKYLTNTVSIEDKALLNIKEFCDYLGIGKTKARELIKIPRNGFSIKRGSKWYIHKQRLDAWLLEQCDKY